MIAYKKDLFEALFLKDEARSLEKAGFMNKKQVKFIETTLLSYNRADNVFVRLGFFILAGMLFSACGGFLGIITAVSGTDNNRYTFLFSALFGFIALETVIIRRMKNYANGIDDAFLILSLGNLFAFIGFSLYDAGSYNLLFASMFVIGLLSCLRYVDRVAAFFAVLGLYALVINFCMEAGGSFKLFLPLVIMGKTAAYYIILMWLKKKNTQRPYYNAIIGFCAGLFTLIFYLAGNYMLVRESNTLLLGNELAPGADISLSYFFWGFTVLCPLVYFYLALKYKKRSLLYIAVICFTLSIYTIRYYHALMPLEVAFLAGGLVLFILAYVSLLKLKGKTSGLSYEADKFQSGEELLNLQALALIEKFGAASAPPTQAQSGAEAGGGEFGGAGSGGNF